MKRLNPVLPLFYNRPEGFWIIVYFCEKVGLAISNAVQWK